MGEFLASRGEWQIVVDNSRRDGIVGRRRSSGVTFSPSASKSRLHFTESGVRYEVRLSQGRLQFRTGTGAFVNLLPGRDPLTGRQLPRGISHHSARLGRRMFQLPLFDMIAVGRGRIFARAEGTDRFFHLKIDELFRASLVRDEAGDSIAFSRFDTPVPSTFIALDAKFYERLNAEAEAPELLGFDYGRHPASLRFGLFRAAMTAGSASSDFTIVPMRTRVWYELESRPPLKVFDFDDILTLTINDLRDVLREEDELLKDIVKEALEENPIVEPVAGFIGPVLDPIAGAIANSVQREIVTHRRLDTLVQLGAIGIAFILRNLNERRSLGGGRRGRALELSDDFLNIGIRPELLLKVLAEDRNPYVDKLIEKVVARGRARRGSTIPNRPPSGLPRYTHVGYQKVLLSAAIGDVIERHSIDFDEVMDLGVGYSHWHEHWHLGYGGEIHSLLAKRPIAQQEGFNSILYRFLNGPVLDGDGYNDGTTNFYILVKLRGRSRPRRRFAILWIDEQTYFSQRWRLVHPNADVRGDLFSLARTIHDHPEYFRFDLAQYWDPFEDDGCINKVSRMAVARQTIAVTGRDPATNRREIFTFTFNYGVSDRTWRWRPMPVRNVRLLSEENLEEPIPVAQGFRRDEVFANTLALREDLTLHLRGVITLSTGTRVAGRWFQRVLPSNLEPVPRALDLTSGKPSTGYSHDWHFFSDKAWMRADRFLVLGAYESRVSARCQYYSVEILPNEHGETPDIATIVGEVWRNEPRSSDPPLAHNTENFTWDLDAGGDGIVRLGQLLERRRERNSMSMYESVTRFRLLDRGRRGIIAVYFDPRDDELQPASHLPQRVTLSRDDFVPKTDPFSDMFPDLGSSQDLGNTPSFKPKAAPIGIGVTFKSHSRVLRPPIVRKVRLARRVVAGRTESVLISFWTPLTDDEATENLWQITIGAPATRGGATILFRSEVFGPFVRAAQPSRPIRFDASTAEELADDHRFDHQWSGFSAAQQRLIDRLCTPDGRTLYGTSVWFEDIVGHIGTPESIDLTKE